MARAQRYGGVIPEPFGSQCNEKEDADIGTMIDSYICTRRGDFVSNR